MMLARSRYVAAGALTLASLIIVLAFTFTYCVRVSVVTSHLHLEPVEPGTIKFLVMSAWNRRETKHRMPISDEDGQPFYRSSGSPFHSGHFDTRAAIVDVKSAPDGMTVSIPLQNEHLESWQLWLEAMEQKYGVIHICCSFPGRELITLPVPSGNQRDGHLMIRLPNTEQRDWVMAVLIEQCDSSEH